MVKVHQNQDFKMFNLINVKKVQAEERNRHRRRHFSNDLKMTGNFQHQYTEKRNVMTCSTESNLNE